jgi:serine/threonine protein kinase
LSYWQCLILGQYGKVFKGIYKRSEGPGYPIAVKTIRKYESEKEKDNFFKEMNVMSKLMHPNIVRLFGIVQQGIHI